MSSSAHSPDPLGALIGALSGREKKVLATVLKRETIAENVNESFSEQTSFGDRLADRVAEFGGSWTFILIFFALLVGWAIVNTVVLVTDAFDPYPFVFLNLILSMLAAVQAPVIMMSQNRQAAKDRLAAEHDYEVNLKAEVEIMALHEKLDHLRAVDLLAYLERQAEEIRVLREIVETRLPPAGN